MTRLALCTTARAALDWAPRALLLALVAALPAACSDSSIFVSAGAPSAGAGQRADALVGRWFRAASADPAAGAAGAIVQTTWDFASDGTAVRTIRLVTALGQVLETSRAVARWRAGGGVLVLDFGAPSFRVLRMTYTVDYGPNGTVLLLDGQRYLHGGS